MRRATCGNTAEAKVLAALIEREFDVLVPFGDGHSYDLGLGLGGRVFLRIQCKTAWPRRGCVVFNSRTTDHGRGRQPYAGLGNLFGVYFHRNDSIYIVPVCEIDGYEGRLRLEPALNNQVKGIRFACDFEIDRWTPESLAAVA